LKLAIHAAATLLLAQVTICLVGSTGIYDLDPEHPWNRLHAELLVRTFPNGNTYGHDLLDPLLWADALLDETPFPRKLAVLDAFIADDAEKLIDAPNARAVLQHDLWSVYDWLAGTADEWPVGYVERARQLQRRLVIIIQRLAMSPKQVAALTANYPAAVDAIDGLPDDLFEGAWVAIGDTSNRGLASRAHVNMAGGRSVFVILMHLPDGRDATRSYLSTFRAEEKDLPTGARLALVRQLLVIDDAGVVRQTPLVESVHLSTYTTAPPQPAAFLMSRRLLLAGIAGGLAAVQVDARSFTRGPEAYTDDPFREPAASPFRQGPPFKVLTSCSDCHHAAGVQSMLSARRGHLGLDVLIGPGIAESTWSAEIRGAIDWKRSRYDWGLLSGMLDKLRHPDK
jgi:hypothetical protein